MEQNLNTARNKVLEYIKERWVKTVRTNMEDDDTLIGLPYPYTVPCAKGKFQELYYWDTYFACRGLMRQGFYEQVRNNCNDFIYEIERFGFVPNGNRTYYLNRSQPPYFAPLVELVYAHYGDKEWLSVALSALEKEHLFWMSKCSTPEGLNHYGHDLEQENLNDVLLEFYSGCCVDRIYMDKDAPDDYKIMKASHTRAEAESGWDFNPRFDQRCMDFAPIDLNCLLYRLEEAIARFHDILENREDVEKWMDIADARKRLINKYCWNDERGAFMDYDFVNDSFSSVLSAASLQPLWVGLASDEQAARTVEAMEKYLECDCGIASCEENDAGILYQWDHPNGWPPLQMIAMDALDRYGFKEQAERVARKYIDTVIDCFEKTGDIWEKYNVVNGSVEVKDNYGMPAMMGWSAAAFIEAYYYLNGTD